MLLKVCLCISAVIRHSGMWLMVHACFEAGTTLRGAAGLLAEGRAESCTTLSHRSVDSCGW